MIVRILGEGQYIVAGPDTGVLRSLDAWLDSAAESGDEATFSAALRALHAAVRRLGTPLPRGTPIASDLVLPRPDTSLAGAHARLTDEGLIPRMTSGTWPRPMLVTLRPPERLRRAPGVGPPR